MKDSVGVGRAEGPRTNAYLERLISNYLAPGAAEAAYPSSEASGYGLGMNVKARGHFSNPSADPPAAGHSEYRGYAGYGVATERGANLAESRKMSGSFSAKERDVSQPAVFASERVVYGTAERVVVGSERVVLNPERTALGPERVVYAGERVVSNPERITLNSERVVLNPERVILNPERVISNSERVTLNPERVVSNPERVTLNSERVVLTGPSAMGVGISPEVVGERRRVVGGLEALQLPGGDEPREEEVEVSIQGVGVYRGPLSGGQMHGFGELRDEKGRLVYRGWFESGEFSGVGELFNPEASAHPPVEDFKTFDLQRLLPWWQRYEGHFKNSVFEGVGQVFFPYKCSFLGEFLAGEATGMGVAIMPKKRVAGRWRANKLLEKL